MSTTVQTSTSSDKSHEIEDAKLWKIFRIDFQREAKEFPDNKIYANINIEPESARKLIEKFFINQEAITDKMTLCIHNNFECGTKHKIRIKAKLKNGTETYQSDLIYFTVPSVEEKQNGEYIYIRNESIPPTIQGVITSDEDTDEEQPEPQRNKFKERALELLQKLENQILLGRTSVM
ncbi:unnamed protein product [Rotaria sp. Silwood1]|nr:unnamed protein product [Rotaria sp. Silwood1]CAF1608347.1 unnamed protein product [Rotaria sp. Silwood1]CAF3709557.1 unnamed protein product [Rotaria sp. Silwood1]CAF4756882.1 unnamed protein product [Rotaria sp. Silwood1]